MHCHWRVVANIFGHLSGINLCRQKLRKLSVAAQHNGIIQIVRFIALTEKFLEPNATTTPTTESVIPVSLSGCGQTFSSFAALFWSLEPHAKRNLRLPAERTSRVELVSLPLPFALTLCVRCQDNCTGNDGQGN